MSAHSLASTEGLDGFPPFDAEAFDLLAGEVGADVMALTLETFFAETDPRLARMAPGAPDLAREAHSLKSGAATFGATRLAEIARRIEHGARTDSAVDTALLDALAEAYVQVRPLLEAHLSATIAQAA